jgi:hypothetical protein
MATLPPASISGAVIEDAKPSKDATTLADPMAASNPAATSGAIATKPSIAGIAAKPAMLL